MSEILYFVLRVLIASIVGVHASRNNRKIYTIKYSPTYLLLTRLSWQKLSSVIIQFDYQFAVASMSFLVIARSNQNPKLLSGGVLGSSIEDSLTLDASIGKLLLLLLLLPRRCLLFHFFFLLLPWFVSSTKGCSFPNTATLSTDPNFPSAAIKSKIS